MRKNIGQVSMAVPDMERTVARRCDRTYLSGRSPDWVKDQEIPDAPAATG
jgi:hypothetical protein